MTFRNVAIGTVTPPPLGWFNVLLLASGSGRLGPSRFEPIRAGRSPARIGSNRLGPSRPEPDPSNRTLNPPKGGAFIVPIAMVVPIDALRPSWWPVKGNRPQVHSKCQAGRARALRTLPAWRVGALLGDIP